MADRASLAIGLAALSLGASASADIFLFDLEGGTQAWDEALEAQGKVLKASFNFDDLDFSGNPAGFFRMDDPLDSGGSHGGNSAGEIPPGFIPDNVVIQSNLDPFGEFGPNPRGIEGLAGVNAGWEGTSTNNAVLPNTNPDSLDIILAGRKTAVDLDVVNFGDTAGEGFDIRGVRLLSITVYDVNDQLLVTFGDLDAPQAGGHRYGLLAMGGDTIGRINIYGDTGFEGLYGLANFYVPAPGALALLGLAGLIGTRRRRR